MFALLAIVLATLGPLGQTRTDSVRQVAAGVPVVFDGDTLFQVRARIGPFGPAERAAAIINRLARIAEDDTFADDTVAIVESDGASDIVLGTFVITTVTEADALAAAVPRAALAAEHARAIAEALAGDSLWTITKLVAGGLAKSLLVAMVVVAILMAMARMFPVIYRTLEGWQGKLIRPIRIQRLELLSAARATAFTVGLARVVRIAMIVLVFFYAIPLVFGFFPWTHDLSDQLFAYILAPVRQIGSAFVGYVPNLFQIAVIVLVTYYLLRFIHLFFDGIHRRKLTFRGFYSEWAEPTYKIVRFLIFAFALVMMFPYLPGSGSDAFKGVSVFFGVLLSFGSAGAIGNIIAGVVITYMRPFKLGDRVRIADALGDVIERTLLVTRVRTSKNVDITIPNAMVLAGHIVNYSSTAKEGGVILHTRVTIGYNVPWKRVHELLVSAAARTEGLMAEPGPFVLQTSLEDSYVRYELNAYTEDPSRMARIYSDLHQHIQDVFNEAGVEIMSPHYGAMRDGNQVAIPTDYLPPAYEAPAFRLFSLGAARPKPSVTPEREPPRPPASPPAGPDDPYT
ncbi:MAG TPA: mechanosensitive ion channel family protein [Gemmatimonadales bacterium]